MSLTTDEYGQIHNSEATYACIAEDLLSLSENNAPPVLFRWADDRMSAFTLLIYVGYDPMTVLQRRLYVGVEGYGFYGFPIDHYLSPEYVATKLNPHRPLAMGSAEPLADLLNGVLDQFIPGRGTPVKEKS